MTTVTDDQVFEWLDSLCTEAKADISLLNAYGRNDAFAYYFNNVFSLKAMSPKTFANTTAMSEARRWHAEYQEHEADKQEKAALKEQITKLEANQAALLEKIDKLTESVNNSGKGKKPAKQDEMDSE